MTDTQVTEFNSRDQVRDHLPNTITGFSGTLLWDRIDNRYVLCFRSLEYADQWSAAGPFAQSGKRGGKVVTTAKVFRAYGQDVVFEWEAP